ncbi:hypothetical protein [Shivajiella indica]|uniref:Uncharacterized protein n=1 Tax=Shivajiella indica TaxID=872115 RepID=A0ABW5B6E7_9BACT
MRTLKNVTKSLFILGITGFLSYFLAISLIGFVQYESFGNQQNIIASNVNVENQLDQKEIESLLSNQELAYESAHIIPFPSSVFSKFFLISDFSKSQFIITYFILGLISLLFATRLITETNIYEFFNKGDDGTVIFESNEIMLFHYFSSYAGKTLKAIGIAFGLVAIITFVI